MDMYNNDKECAITESTVKELQSVLFPISPRKSTSDSFLNNWYMKSTNSNNESTNEDTNFDAACIRGKDSKEIYFKDINSTSQPPRWPTECQVLEERVTHLTYASSVNEPYYIPTGKEVQPKPVGEECGIVIYQYYPISAVNYFSRSSIGGSKYLLSTCPSPEDDSLRFESRFESGNLVKAIKITNVYYELYLRTDLYTNRHMQWFYFRITNMKKFNNYRFSIVNLMKDDSLFNEGMQPLMYSVKDAHIHSLGWRRCGANITYYCNDNMNPDDPDKILFNTLTFTVEFPHDDDTVYLAHSYPYTYSDLQDYLQDLSVNPVKSTYTNIRLLCKTLAGNNVYYITVTSPDSNTDIQKKAIVVTARVHPGETPASWMMKGILDFITSDTGPAKELRDRFIFKIVPMLNPDGVIVGNNRCSLTGKDLNRQYRTVIRESYPSIWYTKLMIRRLLEECGVAMYCDLHAHSRKHNIFVYGCENRRNVERRLLEQVFPLMLHKNAAEKFSFEDCIFRIQRNKEGTGRIVMWMMGICNSYTLEASFGGSTIGSRAENHFSTVDYEQMGKSFCQTLLDFYDDDPRKEKLRSKILLRLLKSGSNADEPANINLTDYSSLLLSDNGDTSSSSSDNEQSRDVEHILVAPPSSPAMVMTHKLEKVKCVRTKGIKSKSAKINRRPLQIFKTTLGLSLAKRKDDSRDYETSSSNSDGEIPCDVKTKATNTKKKKKKREKSDKKKFHGHKSKENEQIIAQKTNEKYVSVLHILPEAEFGKIPVWQESILPNARYIMDNKRNVSSQLVEVQSKLLALKNKLWFGVGDADGYAPLSWTSSLRQTASHDTNPKQKLKKQVTVDDNPKLSMKSRLKRSTSNQEKRVISPNRPYTKSKHRNDRLKETMQSKKDTLAVVEQKMDQDLKEKHKRKKKKIKKKSKSLS